MSMQSKGQEVGKMITWANGQGIEIQVLSLKYQP